MRDDIPRPPRPDAGAQPDVLRAIAGKLAASNVKQRHDPQQVAKADVAKREGLDEHNLQQGYLSSTADALARRLKGEAPGSVPGTAGSVAGPNRLSAAMQTAVALGLVGTSVRKAAPAPPRPVDDPTGAVQTLETLKRLHAGGSPQAQQHRHAAARGGTADDLMQPLPVLKSRIKSRSGLRTLGEAWRAKKVAQRVRKAQGVPDKALAIYDTDGKLAGFADPADLEDEGSIAEAVYGVDGRQIGFLDPKDLIAIDKPPSIEDDDAPPTQEAVTKAFRTLKAPESVSGRQLMKAVEIFGRATPAQTLEAYRAVRAMPPERIRKALAAPANAKRYVLGVAYPASKVANGTVDRRDGHGDFMTAEEVEKAAFDYLANHREIGFFHADGTTGHGQIVESFIHHGAPWETTDIAGEQQVIREGDWLLGAVLDEPGFDIVQRGLADGWSVDGDAWKRPGPDGVGKEMFSAQFPRVDVVKGPAHGRRFLVLKAQAQPRA